MNSWQNTSILFLSTFRDKIIYIFFKFQWFIFITWIIWFCIFTINMMIQLSFSFIIFNKINLLCFLIKLIYWFVNTFHNIVIFSNLNSSNEICSLTAQLRERSALIWTMTPFKFLFISGFPYKSKCQVM